MDKEQYEILFRIEERHWWYLGMRQIVGSILEKQLDVSRSPLILDAGCGTGGMVQYLRRFGPVVGVDFSPEAIGYCRQRGLTSVVRGSVEDLPFDSGSFDVVVSFDVIYHRAVKDDRSALREFYRVLRPGGLLLVRVPAYDWLRGAHDVAVHTQRRYSRRNLAAKLGQAGFGIVRLTHVNSLLFPIAALKRLAEGTRRSVRPDLEMPSPLVNRALGGVLSLETAMLQAFSFPWGLSVLALATKPMDSQSWRASQPRLGSNSQ